MLKADIIEQTNTEWASSVVVAPKQDVSLSFCTDYRRLKSVMVGESYQIQRMDYCKDFLGESKIFRTIDCNSGYW